MILNEMLAARSPSILIVGASRPTAGILSRDLGPRVTVPVVGSGEEALERILLDASIAAVLVQPSLPGMSGETFVRRLRASRSPRLRGLPAIALGGEHIDATEAGNLLAAGANAVLTSSRAETELTATLWRLLPSTFDVRAPEPSVVGESAATAVRHTGPKSVESVLRLRWQTRGANDADSGGARTAIDQQIRAAFERHLRSRDRWFPDNDGRGGLLGLTCSLSEALRPLLRLAVRLNDAAAHFNRRVAISMALETAGAAGTIDIADPLRQGEFPELPQVGELAVALPRAHYRLKLDRVGRS